MEGWSPQTLHNLRFCMLDEEGNSVSVWNFGDLEELLRDFEDPEECEGSPVTVVDLHTPVHTPSSECEETACAYRNLHTSGSICRGGCTRYRSIDAAWPVDIYVKDRYALTSQCESFYDDMPPLESPDEYLTELAGMPELESAAISPVCVARGGRNGHARCSVSSAANVEHDLMFRLWAKEIYLAAIVLLVRALCTLQSLHEGEANVIVNAMILLYAGYFSSY
ncbi:hypothetical protein M758_UG049400 [Ceratodon purpureus]|nr:hypothetical protein M758_UG049400 [Ceratodon purpureus]